MPVFLLFFPLKVVHPEPGAASSITVWFPLLWTGSRRGLCSGVFALVSLWFSMFLCWSLQFWRLRSALWPHVFHEAKKGCFSFSLFCFLPSVGMPRGLPASGTLETKLVISFLPGLFNEVSCYLCEFCGILLSPSFSVLGKLVMRGRGSDSVLYFW